MSSFAHRLAAALVAVAVFFMVLPVPVGAQSSGDTGIISITVMNSADKTPVGDARVFLLGPTVATALTTTSGIVKYTDVPSGLYRVRVSKNGFAGSTSSQFEVLGEKEIDVTVALGVQNGNANRPSVATSDAGEPTIIGRVEARVTITTRDVDENSAIRKISDSLTDALGTIAGVDVTTDSNDPNAPQTISLRGHDESQTAVTLDGIPLSAPGSATNLRGINTDLFTGAGVSFGAQAGALGGAVNFRTLQPTQTWQSRASSSYGTFDKFNYQLGETGSIGKLGIALLHTDRQGNSPLTFQNYLDASGQTYPHDGESTNRGDFVKLRYGLTDSTTLNFTALQNNQASSSLCTQFVTLEPCGIGPLNGSSNKFQFVYGSVQTLIGETALSVTGYVNNNASRTNDQNRFIDGVASPFASATNSLARGLAFSSTLTRNKHTFTLSGSTYAGTTNFTPIAGITPFVFAATNASSSQSYQFADSFKSNDKLTLGANVSLAGTTGAGSSFVGGLSAAWRPIGTDSFNASFSVGSAQPASGIIRTYSDPSSARVNCFAGTATVSGPGEQNTPQSAINYDAGWQHSWKKGQVTLDVYRQNQDGQLINALLTGASAGLPPGYASEVNQYYMQGTVCGAAAALPTIYVNQLINNTNRVYQGFSLSGRVGIGPNIVVIPSYTTASAVVTSADALLLSANSTTIIGSQIPGRPLHRGNLTIDASEPHTGIELLANASYVGENNSQHLTPYTLVNLGISHQVGIGRVTLFASNLFNTEAADFSTLLYSQPIALNGGGFLATAANPNTPRSYTMTYSFNTGALRGAGFARRAGTPSAPRAPSGAAVASAPGASPAPADNLRGRFTFLPPPDGTDPLTIGTARDSCPVDSAPKAQAVVDQFKAVVTAFKAGEKLPDVPGFTITPHGTPAGTDWFIEFRTNAARGGAPGAGGAANANRPPGGFGRGGPGGGAPGGPGGPGGPIFVPPASSAPNPRPSISPETRARLEAFRAFIGCAYITALKSPEAKAKNITVNGPAFGYSPQVGFFFVQPPELGTGGGSVKQ